LRQVLYNRGVKSAKPKKLTTKERGLVRELSNGKTLTTAARDAGYSGKNPGQSGWQALHNIQRKMSEILDSQGLTDELLIEKHLKPLLRATETKFFQAEGRVTDTRRVPSLRTRVKALDMAFRLKGSFPAQSENKPEENYVRVIVLNSPRPPLDALREAQRLAAVPDSEEESPTDVTAEFDGYGGEDAGPECSPRPQLNDKG
jgi:hypothetical protein